MSIGANDNIDKLMIEKYKDKILIDKNNYIASKMSENNYLPKEINHLKEFCTISAEEEHRAISNADRIDRLYQKLIKHPIIFRKQLKEYKDEKKLDIYHSNRMYERLGCNVIMIGLGSELSQEIGINSVDDNNLFPFLAFFRQKMVDDLGYIIPNIKIMNESNLKPYEYRILIRNRVICNNLLSENILKDTQIKEIITNLQKTCISYAPQIMSKADVIKLIELVRSQDPTLVNDLVPILLSPIDIKHVLVKLIQDQISIKDIIYIFELLNDYARYTNDVDILTEQLKRDLQF